MAIVRRGLMSIGLRHFEVTKHAEAAVPTDGMWPGSRRILRGIIEKKDGRFKVNHVGKGGYKWMDDTGLPKIVVKAYQLSKPDDTNSE
jgi:hypothetical protein